ncbi:MAG: response regulator [Elusimicrobia bacterium]|nr:response regulator [Elusimicrobiota bacterium]
MSPSSAPRLRLLVVDDEPADVELHQDVLSAAGYTVVTAGSLAAARKALAAKPCQLLLVDLRLPDGDGLSLLEDAHAADPHAAAVVLTGFSSVENAVAALKAGAYDFLAKPCPEERLLASIHRAAERYELSRTLVVRTGELESMNSQLDRRVKDATQEIFTLNEKLKKTVSELVDINKRQTRFLEDMAHELKNPLAVVIGYSSFLLRRPMSEWTHEELERSLQSVARNSQHLHALIEELLDSARLAGRKMTLKVEPVDAGQAAREAAEAWRPKAEEHGIVLDVPEAAPMASEAALPRDNARSAAPRRISADPNRLRQILNNLISNALKFTPRGGRVSVSVHAEGTGTLFRVADTGPGIPAKDAERIFERFYQVEGKHQDHVRGLGLGLSITAGLVQLHGGRIWVESDTGQGARFFFLLPERVPQASEQAPTETVAPSRS